MQALGITAAQVNLQLRHPESRLPRRPRRRSAAPNRRSACSGKRAPRTRSATRRSCCPAGASRASATWRTCKDSVGEIRALARLNDRPATIFKVFKAKGSSDINVLNGVEAELAKIRSRTRR